MPNEKLEEIVDAVKPMLDNMVSKFPSRQFEIRMHPKDWEEIFGFEIDGVPVRIDLDALVRRGEPLVTVRPFDGPS